MNTGEPLISVIVPIYKVESYLRRCVDSLLGQSYSNMEIILVDDGSPDSCGMICDEYAAQDSRVRVIHQENQGLGPARNSGLDVARGAYIAFIDSDDYVRSDYLEVLLRDMEEQDVDVVCCEMVPVCDDGAIRGVGGFVSYSRKIEHDQIAATLEKGDELFWRSAWAKLFKSEFAQKQRFQLRLYEDVPFTLDIYRLEPRIYLDTYPGYFYYMRSDSLTGRENRLVPRRIDDRLKFIDCIFAKLMCFKDTAEDRAMKKVYLDLCAEHLFVAIQISAMQKDTETMKRYREKLLSWLQTLSDEGAEMSAQHSSLTHLYVRCPWLFRAFCRIYYTKLCYWIYDAKKTLHRRSSKRKDG